jgi:hypothetical protein
VTRSSCWRGASTWSCWSSLASTGTLLSSLRERLWRSGRLGGSGMAGKAPAVRSTWAENPLMGSAWRKKQKIQQLLADSWTNFEYCSDHHPTITYILSDSAPNLGPLISRWEINKFENCRYRSVRI